VCPFFFFFPPSLEKKKNSTKPRFKSRLSKPLAKMARFLAFVYALAVAVVLSASPSSASSR